MEEYKQNHKLAYPQSSSSTIEQIISKPCARHPEESSEFIHLSQSASDPRICMACISKNNINMNNTLSIRQVLKATQDSFLTNYPVIESDGELQQVMTSYVKTIESLASQIQQFLDSLKKSVEEQIERAKSAAKNSLIQLEKLFDLTKSSVQYVSQIEDLQQILKGNDPGNKRLGEFIKHHCENKEENTAIINENYIKLKKQLMDFSLERPNQIMIEVSKLLKDVDLFAGKNSSPLQFNPVVECQMNQNQNLLKPAQQIQPKSKQQQQISVISSLNITPSIKFEKNCKIERMQNGSIKLMLKNGDLGYVQVYFSQQLIPKTKLVIRLQFLSNNQSVPFFCFGLIQDQKKDHEYVNDQGMSHDEFYSKKGLHNVVKGSQLRTRGHFSQKRVEVRLHLAERYFAASDLPNYENVVELDDPMKIKPDQKYYFAIFFCYEGNSVIIEDVLEVANFDDKMDKQQPLYF